MDFGLHLLVDLGIILILLAGIQQFRKPESARRGNFMAALALLLAVAIVIIRHGISQPHIVIVALLLGSAIGWTISVRVNMIQIPAMVAFQHGAGGITAFLVSFLELTRVAHPLSDVGKFSGIFSLIIGAATFSGSLIASGKLANVLKQQPVVLPKHNWFLISIIALIIAASIFAFRSSSALLIIFAGILILLSIALGIVFSIRIGGADMPVLISFLNATAGVAAAFCGVVISNRLLIAAGATVAASGSILTHVMCKAMNRNLKSVFVGFQAKGDFDWTEAMADEGVEEGDQNIVDDGNEPSDPLERAVKAAREAKTVIFIPGYGMALAQAQYIANKLTQYFEQQGKKVRFAIHPVAGRMPGHMNVLLAEAEVEYDKLLEMKNINSDFDETDLAIVVGASDVVNPAALKVKNSPISGMPILNAHKAKHVIICNLDERPGYSGVENSLYKKANAILLFGDAKESLSTLYQELSGEKIDLEER